MTYRQQLDHRLKRWWPPHVLAPACILLVIALLLAPVFGVPKPSVLGPAVLALAVVNIVGWCIQVGRCCCPSCRKNLASAFGPAGLPAEFRNCPSCAFDLEQEIGTANAAIRWP
jgi:hypothetical protein